MNESNSCNEKSSAETFFLEIKNLSKRFVSDGKIIQVVSVNEFSLQKGQQIAIRGPSGSGKSTFLNLISGIMVPDDGVVRISDFVMNDLSESDRDRKRATVIGHIFQSFHLLQGCTALENIMIAMALGGRTSIDRARSLLNEVGMGDRENYLPSQLSIGQQQRVCLARAIANEPQLVLADEPTGNLDSFNAQLAIELLRKLCQINQSTLIMVSHDPAIMNGFDCLIEWDVLNQKNFPIDEN